eukprot:1376982-Amphidinium_carterae.1
MLERLAEDLHASDEFLIIADCKVEAQHAVTDRKKPLTQGSKMGFLILESPHPKVVKSSF